MIYRYRIQYIESSLVWYGTIWNGIDKLPKAVNSNQANLCFHCPEWSCKHNSVIWEEASQTPPIYCRYIPSNKTCTKLYCLVTEAHVREQLAHGFYRVRVFTRWTKHEANVLNIHVHEVCSMSASCRSQCFISKTWNNAHVYSIHLLHVWFTV